MAKRRRSRATRNPKGYFNTERGRSNNQRRSSQAAPSAEDSSASDVLSYRRALIPVAEGAWEYRREYYPERNLWSTKIKGSPNPLTERPACACKIELVAYHLFAMQIAHRLKKTGLQDGRFQVQRCSFLVRLDEGRTIIVSCGVDDGLLATLDMPAAAA